MIGPLVSIYDYWEREAWGNKAQSDVLANQRFSDEIEGVGHNSEAVAVKCDTARSEQRIEVREAGQ